jgi:hypothetical protein
MTTAVTAKPIRKAAKMITTSKPVKGKSVVYRKLATHQDLLDDMVAFRREVTASPDTARAFLIRAGLLTKNGKQKQLIRG